MHHAGHKVTVRWIQTRTGEWVLYHFTHTFISLFIYSFFFIFSPYIQYIILTSHCIYMHRYFATIQNMSVFSVWCEWWKYPSLIGFLCFWVWHWVSNYTVGYDILSETFNSAYSFKQKVRNKQEEKTYFLSHAITLWKQSIWDGVSLTSPKNFSPNNNS